MGVESMNKILLMHVKNILGNKTKVIATGGNSNLMKKYARYIQIIDEDLTLKGLQFISVK